MNHGIAGAAESLRLQCGAVLAAVALVASWHWGNDGLWFQGDAPRHAATGLFFWDLLTALPSDPLDYALRYYARYPVLVLGAYPPLFHVVEGLGYGLFGASPYVPRAIVLACVALTGLYAVAWGRRWLGPLAGWAGACTVLLPGYTRYGNAVLLNVPAAALGLAALYHLQVWLDEGTRRHRALFVGCATASVLTYYPGAMVLPMAFAWLVFTTHRAGVRFVVPVAGLLAALVIALGVAMPEHFARQVPSLSRLVSPINWLFYPQQLRTMIGALWLGLAGLGVALAVASSPRRAATLRLATAFAIGLLCLSLLPARDERYTLLLGPIVVLAAFAAVVRLGEHRAAWAPVAAVTLVALLLGTTAQAAATTRVMQVSGPEQVARYLREAGPADSVLYSGIYDGVFGFYARALDPGYARRVVFSGRLLYTYQQAIDFTWTETPHVASAEDVVQLMQRESGCRWVAVEVGGEGLLSATEYWLRRAVEGPAFERVRSFPVTGRPVTRIDLYRFVLPLEPAPPIDLAFPSFSSRIFRGVEPISAPH